MSTGFISPCSVLTTNSCDGLSDGGPGILSYNNVFCHFVKKFVLLTGLEPAHPQRILGLKPSVSTIPPQKRIKISWDDWIRTSDHLLPKQAFYLTELHPIDHNN